MDMLNPTLAYPAGRGAIARARWASSLRAAVALQLPPGVPPLSGPQNPLAGHGGARPPSPGLRGRAPDWTKWGPGLWPPGVELRLAPGDALRGPGLSQMATRSPGGVGPALRRDFFWKRWGGLRRGPP